MGFLIALFGFLSALFAPAADGGPSVFESIVGMLLGLWSDVAQTA